MGTEVKVSALPTCDIHEYVLRKGVVTAHYDGVTKLPGSQWANMCEDCFQTYGVGLGTGRGQHLVVREVKS